MKAGCATRFDPLYPPGIFHLTGFCLPLLSSDESPLLLWPHADTTATICVLSFLTKRCGAKKWVMRGKRSASRSPQIQSSFFCPTSFCLQDDQRGRIEQEVAEKTETLVNSPLFSPISPLVRRKDTDSTYAHSLHQR